MDRNRKACIEYNALSCPDTINRTAILDQATVDNCDANMDNIVADYGECSPPYVETCSLYTAVDTTLAGILAQLDNDNINDVCQ